MSNLKQRLAALTIDEAEAFNRDPNSYGDAVIVTDRAGFPQTSTVDWRELRQALADEYPFADGQDGFNVFASDVNNDPAIQHMKLGGRPDMSGRPVGSGK